MLNARLDRLNDYPFQRLTDLLAGTNPRANTAPVLMHVGEPQHAPPGFALDVIAADRETWNRYPPIAGTPALREACATWLMRRYRVPAAMLDPHRQVAPVAGTREGLFIAGLAAVTPAEGGPRPLALMPNPFYQVYFGAAVMAGAEPVFLPATKASGFLPDLDAIDAATLARTAIFYLCSPANPQGSVASLAYWTRALELARRHDFLLVADECYSELWYGKAQPTGALEAAVAMGPGPNGHAFDNLLVSHTLSKRSSAPGLRSGFVAGAPATIAMVNRLRSYSCASTPIAVMDAATRLWLDEEHVVATRALYRRKYEIADRLLGGRFGYARPEGGFYLWLDVGDGEAATKRLWAEAAIRALPGAYLTKPSADGGNAGAKYLRLALVHDLETTEAALTRLAQVL